MRKIPLFLAALIFTDLAVMAQFQIRDSSLFDPHITLSAAYQTPGGDLANRFSNNLNIGLGFHIKTKTEWIFGIQGTYLFGNRVNEPNFLANLRTDAGEILDNQGQVAVVIPQERGFTVSLQGGYLFNVIGPNRNSGLLLRGGVGMLQHKIRIEHQENAITQLEGEYLKGYDRLTNGWMVDQFAGYYHMSNNGLINFVIGLEAYQGFTKSRRDLNFDTQSSDTASRLDMLVGIRAGWVLHLYQRAPVVQYFN